MNITLQTEFLNIVGFFVGILGLLIAFWQIISARRMRLMYQEKCSTRCKDLVESVGQLERAVGQSCKIKDESLDNIMNGTFDSKKSIRPLRQLSDQLHSIYDTKNHLVRFCERLNDEHQMEFGQPVYENIREKFNDFPINTLTPHEINLPVQQLTETN